MTSTNRRPIAFILAATNHGSMLVNRHDYRITDHAAYGVGHQLLSHSAFDPEEVDFALQLLQLRRQHFGDGVVAIDCGANIGVHTIEWARHMHGWGSVTAFEAQERIFYALAGNITMNNCFNARAVWAAVGQRRGSIFVPTPDYFVPSSFGSLEIQRRDNTEFIGQAIDYDGDNMQVTPMVAIDDQLLDRIDFIKIDIEGMEMDALLGAQSSIERFKPQLMIEKIKSNEADIRAFVTDRGYQVFDIGINLLAVHADDPAATAIRIK